MTIDKINSLDALHAYQGGADENGQGKASYRDRLAHQAAISGVELPIDDETSFMGIPEAELTPNVVAALSQLMEKVDHLSNDVRHEQALEEKLSASVDRHSDLPVLTRHALLREVQVIAYQAQRTSTSAVFVYLQVSNFAALKGDFGLLAGEAVLKEIAQLIKNDLRQTDQIGTLGGDGFGLLLPLSDLKSAAAKLKDLAEHIENGPLMFDGKVMDAKIAYGLHSLHVSEATEDILRAVDSDLKTRFKR